MDTNILFYRLDLITVWLRSAFAVALIRQPYAMSQHLFPSRVALIFGLDFVLMTGENHSFSLFQHIPNTFNGVKVRTLRWPIHVWKCLLVLPDTHVSSCSTLSQLEPDESWHCGPGICLSHQGEKNDGITWSFSTNTCWQKKKNQKPTLLLHGPGLPTPEVISDHTWKNAHRKFTGNSQENRANRRASGAMDNASDYGSEDSRFDSWLARFLLQIICVHSFYRLYVFIAHAFNYCGQKRISSTTCSWVNLNMTQFW